MLRNLSTGIEASATGEYLNSGDPAVHPAARHNIDIVVTTGSAGGISAEESGLELGPCSTRTREEGSNCGSCKGRLACV